MSLPPATFVSKICIQGLLSVEMNMVFLDYWSGKLDTYVVPKCGASSTTGVQREQGNCGLERRFGEGSKEAGRTELWFSQIIGLGNL